MKYHLLFLLISTTAISLIGAAEVWQIQSDAEDPFTIVIEPEDSFQSVIDRLRLGGGNISAARIDIVVSGQQILAQATPALSDEQRDYYAPLSGKEKDDISYILRTLANHSLAKIAGQKSSLKKAGDRIDHIHPFRFLQFVFTDEELKICIRNLRGRSFVWKDFIEGITDSLAKESALDNLTYEHLQDLTNQVKLDINVLLPHVQSKRWYELVNTMIEQVPRAGGPNRYDM